MKNTAKITYLELVRKLQVKPRCTKSETKIYQKARKQLFFLTLTLTDLKAPKFPKVEKQIHFGAHLFTNRAAKVRLCGGAERGKALGGPVSAEPIPPPGRLLPLCLL